MKLTMRFARQLDTDIRTDLSRRHEFAAERVGFVSGTHVNTSENSVLILLDRYHSIADEDYIRDRTVGARISGSAIRKAMQYILDTGNGMFHVHIHPFDPTPGLSHTDEREIPPLVRNFRSVNPETTNGILLLGNRRHKAWINVPGTTELITTTRIVVVGFPLFLNI